MMPVTAAPAESTNNSGPAPVSWDDAAREGSEANRQLAWFGSHASFVALAVATCVIFSQALWFGFIGFDDPAYVVDNPLVRGGWSWAAAWQALFEFRAANWHPLVWWTYMLEVELFGLSAGVMHATNVALHVVNALLVGYWLKSATGSGWRSWLAAAMFALHPLHVESVAWVAERKDVLCALFWFLSLWSYTEWASRSSATARARFGWYVASLLCFVAGLLSKPMIVTLPCVLLLMDVWPLRRWPPVSGDSPVRRAAGLLIEKLPFFAMTLGACVLTVLAQKSGGAVRSMQESGLPTRFAQSLIGYAQYLWQTVYPVGLTVFYPRPDQVAFGSLVLSAVLLLGVTAVCLWRFKAAPALLIGWLWFVGTLVPVIGLVQVGNQAYADRYMYLPMVGLSLMLLWGLPERWQTRHAQGWLVGGLAAVTVWGALTWGQVARWKDTETLFTYSLGVTGSNFVGELMLAHYYQERGEFERAVPHLQRARQLNPRNAEPLVVLADLAILQGNAAAATPLIAEARRLDPDDPLVQLTFAKWASAQGQHAAAWQAIEAYLAEDPGSPRAQVLAGIVLSDLGRPDEARLHFQRAIQSVPDELTAWTGLGRLEMSQGQFAAARRAYETALQLKPGAPDIEVALAVVDAQEGKISAAVARLQALLQRQPYPPAEQLLGMLRAGR